MFEGIVAALLNKYLSEYIDEVDYNNLKLGIFNGTIELLNVKIKPTSLYQFDLPILVKRGIIGKLKINISWKNIMNKPAVAVIEDLFVFLGPFEDKINDPKRCEEIFEAYKRKKLLENEQIDQAELYENKEKGFAEKLQDTIINNIQIYVKNVHIRYEDKHSLPNKNVSFGVYIKELKAETVDANGKPNFMNANEKVIFKSGTLKGFNLYWNISDNPNDLITMQPNFKTEKNSWIDHLKYSIESGQILNSPFDKFIANNLDLDIRLTLRRSYTREDFSLPKIAIQSTVNAIEFIFQRHQYKTILEIIDYYSMLNVHKNYVKYRPLELENLKEKNYKLWWHYAFTALAETTWRSYKKERIIEHFRSYKLYVLKYEQKVIAQKNNKQLNDKDLKTLEQLEKKLNLESIFDARKLAKDKHIKVPESIMKSLEIPKDAIEQDKYIMFRLVINLPLISIKLKNAGFDILQINFKHILSKFELKPNSNYFLLNTKGIDIYGIYYEGNFKTGQNHQLVPIVRPKLEEIGSQRSSSIFSADSEASSSNNLFSTVTFYPVEDANDVLLSFCFETNPPHIKNAEFSIRTRVSSLEISYEKTAITELLRFFRTDLIDFEEVKKIREAWSRAGLIYAVENHKQFHIKAELSSPYFIIPVKGTSLQQGDSIIFFLGKTMIQSELQEKQSNYTATDPQDLEKNFYDKLTLSVNDVQVAMIPSDIDWRDYLDNCNKIKNYKYHLLYPVSTTNEVFISINPSYKKLPKLKLNATCSSIRLNFSDHKIIKLADFAQKFPVPEIPKTYQSDNKQITNFQVAPNTASNNNNKKTKAEISDNTGLSNKKNKKNISQLSTEFEPEPDDEWDGPFNLPKSINGDPIPNYSQVVLKFKINDFTIDLKTVMREKSDELSLEESDYLKLILNTIKIDLAITKYGLHLRAGLDDLKLIDKIHRNDLNNFTEILSSSSTKDNKNQIIKFYFRQVDSEAPNFSSIYNKILLNVLFDCSNIHLVCHRTAIIYFIKYAKRITDNISINGNGNDKENSKNSNKDIKSINNKPAINTHQQIQHTSNLNLNTISNINLSDGICDFNVIAKMNELTWRMFDTNFSFGNLKASEFKLNYNLSGPKTDLRIKLRTVIINYDDSFYSVKNDNENDLCAITQLGEHHTSINSFYKQIITCSADTDTKNFFDFNLILFDSVPQDETAMSKQKDLIELTVGKIKVILLVKFFNELIDFVDPIITPLTEQVKEQAIEAVNAVKNAYQETKSEGKRIYLKIHVTSPQVIIPQNSTSYSAFLVDLGNLRIYNKFINKPILNKTDEYNVIDEINLSLLNVEIKRISFDRTNCNLFRVREQVFEPINLNAKVKRALINLDQDELADIEIYVGINDLKSMISLKSAKLLFAILDENLNEGLNSINDKKEEPILSTESQKANKKSVNINQKGNIKTEEKGVKLEDSKNRVTMKINVELNKINLMIVELKKLKEDEMHRSRDESLSTLMNSTKQNSYSSSSANLLVITQVNFSHLEIDEIRFNFINYENQTWSFDFKIKDLFLKDLRPDSNLAVKEMFIPLSKNSCFFQMVYDFDPKTESKLDFTVDDIRVNLCLPYILKLYSMAMEAISSTNKTTNKNDNKTNENAGSEVSKYSANFKKKNENKNINKTVIVNENVDEKNMDAVPLKVKGKINLKEIVLFAEPEKPNSKTLIMNTLLELKFESEKQRTNLVIDIVELGIRLGEYTKEKRHGIQFLSPCNAMITMRQSDPNAPALYNVLIDSLYFNMTPTLYETVMGVINTINRSGTEKVKDEVVKKKLLEDSEPFVRYKFEMDKGQEADELSIKSFEENANKNIENNIVNKNSNEEINSNEVEPKKDIVQQVLEALDLTIKDAYITFCEETGIDLQPLAIVKLELNGRVSNWTKNLHTKASLTLEASYYNDRLSNWEPLIENIMQNEDNYRPWLLSVWFAMEPGCILQPPSENEKIQMIDFPIKDIDYSKLEAEENNENISDDTSIKEDLTNLTQNNDEEITNRTRQAITMSNFEDEQERDEKKTASFVLIESNDMMNINVTPSAYRVIMYLAQITAGSFKREILENNSKAPLKFLNFLGEDCELTLARGTLLNPEHAVGFTLSPENQVSLKKPKLSQTQSNDIMLASQTVIEASKERIQKIATESQRPQIEAVYNENYKFTIHVGGYEKCKLSMKNDGSFVYKLNQADSNMSESSEITSQRTNRYEAPRRDMMYKVKTSYGRTKVILSSPLQIENHCQIRLLIIVEIDESKNPEIRKKLNILKEIKITDENNTTKLYGVIFKLLPSKIFYAPLYAAYNCKIYTTPDNESYQPSLVFDIKGYILKPEEIKDICCKKITSFEKNDHLKPVDNNDFDLLRTMTFNVSKANWIPQMSANRRISLYPPIRICNSLPLEVRIDVESTYVTSVKPGESLNIHLNPSKLQKCLIHVIDYLKVNWHGQIDWSKFLDRRTKTTKVEMSVSIRHETRVVNKHLNIYIHYQSPYEFTFYSPYWLVNKSGKQINLKPQSTRPAEDTRVFEIPDEEIVLFDYKSERKNNKVSMSIDLNCKKWSDLFGLDAAGTTGAIRCEDNGRTFNFLIRTTMSNSLRTKLITFAPFLNIANQLDEDILIREWHRNDHKQHNQEWTNVAPTEDTSKPVAYWPNYEKDKDTYFFIKLGDSYETQPFPLDNPGRFVLIAKQKSQTTTQFDLNQSFSSQNLDGVEFSNQKIITVLISGGTNNPVTIVVRKYQYGDSVAKLINLCGDLNIHFKQPKMNTIWKLEPFNSMFFVWPDLVKSNRELQWTVNNPNEMISTNFEPLNLTKSGKIIRDFLLPVNEPTIETIRQDHDISNENDNVNLLKAKFHASNPVSKLSLVKVNCVSYMNETQRVILFTKDDKLAEIERSKECSSMEIFLALKGIQVSVINNVNLEIASLAINDSKVSWELENENEKKTFTNEYSDWLEHNYRNYLKRVNSKYLSFKSTSNQLANSLNHRQKYLIYKDNKFEIDFKNMLLIRPEIGRLKRKWNPGLAVQYRTSTNLMSFKSSLYKIQIDNQLPDAYFPICFYKNNNNNNTKEMTEMISMSLFTEQQEVTQIYRHLDLIMQEFYLKLDLGFIKSFQDWYEAATDETNKLNENVELGEDDELAEPDNLLLIVDQNKIQMDKMNADLNLTKEIMEYVNQQGGVKQSAKIRFENLYISPIIFNLSFSVSGTEHNDDPKAETKTSNRIINFFFESVGATITEFKDVKFKFRMFRVNNQTRTWDELYADLFDNYKIQILHQAYVLILGLDVLGNPFGLMTDFSQGITDLFYDPLLDYLSNSNDGTNKMIEFNMKNRINTTVIKTVSSAAGSGSLITGSIGRVMATCTFDKEYKKKRQYKLSKVSTMSLQDNMTVAGKNIVAGLVYGLTGLVRKPVEARKRDDNKPLAILKGIGKGCIGLFTKPIGSIFDGLSITLDGLKRFSQSGSEQTVNSRLPRYLLNEVAILPYSEYQAKGYEILRDLQNDDIAKDESYWAHIFIDPKVKHIKNSRFLLFITNQHIFKLKKTRTEILKKWHLIEKSISLKKVNGTEIENMSERNELNLYRRKQTYLNNSNTNLNPTKESGFFVLYLLCNDMKKNKNDSQEYKQQLLFSDLRTIEWINDKINSAIKFNKESKNVLKI